MDRFLRLTDNMKDMKKIIAIICFAAAAFSCAKQDSVYKEFIVEGGHVYPAKVKVLNALSGFQRIALEWEKPFDPSLKSAKVYWDNYSQSLDVDYAQFADGNVSVLINDLEDRAYTFDVVNFDDKGNRSLAQELSVTPFGNNWLLSHTERSVANAVMDGNDARINMTKSTMEMTATQFRYYNEAGEKVEYEKILVPEENEMVLPNAKKGKRFEFRSAYKPEKGMDIVWTPNWSKSPDALAYALPTNTWDVTVTKDQEFSTFTVDKIFDGVVSSSNRWHSSRTAAIAKNVKVIAIDSKVEAGKEYTITSLEFFLNTSSSKTYHWIREVYLYIGDKPFNPDVEDPVATYGDYTYKMTFNQNDIVQSMNLRASKAGRYMALVFTNSYNTSGYIDLWELVPYGYIPSEAE